jgi:stearoyl-CoA desaturase (delta-9 desaturase)
MLSFREAVSDTRAAGQTPVAHPPPAAPDILTPRPDRSRAWIVMNAVRGTWFLVLIHVGAAATLFTTPSWWAWALVLPLLWARGMITTVGYHRYFSHRSFKTFRLGQFVLACLCCTNLQRGPLWWAAIHRHHHKHSD